MFKTVYSLDETDKKSIEFKKIDIVGTDDLISLLKEISNNKIILAKKDVSVYAIPARLGEQVDIRTRFNLNGRIYTFKRNKRVIDEKDVATNAMIVSYTDGQSKIIKGEQFESMYKLENKNWELYKPNDTAKKFVTITQNVWFKTPWGEEVFAPIGSKLCVEFLATRDIFIVTNSLFKVAYNIVNYLGSLDDLKDNS